MYTVYIPDCRDLSWLPGRAGRPCRPPGPPPRPSAGQSRPDGAAAPTAGWIHTAPYLWNSRCEVGVGSIKSTQPIDCLCIIHTMGRSWWLAAALLQLWDTIRGETKCVRAKRCSMVFDVSEPKLNRVPQKLMQNWSLAVKDRITMNFSADCTAMTNANSMDRSSTNNLRRYIPIGGWMFRMFQKAFLLSHWTALNRCNITLLVVLLLPLPSSLTELGKQSMITIMQLLLQMCCCLNANETSLKNGEFSFK